MQLEHLKIIVYEFFLVGGGGGGGGGAKKDYGQLEIQIFITMYFVTPSFELVPCSQECEERSRMTKIKLWSTVMVLGIHITSGVIFLGLLVFPKGCVQVGTVKVHMSCVRIQLHW